MFHKHWQWYPGFHCTTKLVFWTIYLATIWTCLKWHCSNKNARNYLYTFFHYCQFHIFEHKVLIMKLCIPKMQCFSNMRLLKKTLIFPIPKIVSWVGEIVNIYTYHQHLLNVEKYFDIFFKCITISPIPTIKQY